MSYQDDPNPHAANNGRGWRHSQGYDSAVNCGRLAIRHGHPCEFVSAATFDMLKWMSPQATAAFHLRVRRRSYAAGKAIYTQDEPGEEMYRIVSGFVRLLIRRSNGKEAVFLVFGPNDCFGVSSLVDGEPRPQTAEAVTLVVTDVLDQRNFASLKAEHPSFDDSLMRLLAQQMRTVSSYYADTNLNRLSARVAARILELAGALTATDRASQHLPLRISQADIAALVGASRQSVNKVLGTLQAQGLIAVQPCDIVVRDAIGLSHVAEPAE